MAAGSVPLARPPVLQRPSSGADGPSRKGVRSSGRPCRPPGVDGLGSNSKASPRLVESPPAGWQSLGDWHKQLAVSPEARRLNVWQLAYGRPVSTSPTLCLPPPGLSSSSRHASVSIAPAQPPYPQLPQSAPQDPASVRRVGKPIASGGGAGRRPGLPPRAGDPRSGGTGWRSASPNRSPPGLCEAVATLSRGVMRSRWHSSAVARSSSPRPKESTESSIEASDVASHKPTAVALPTEVLAGIASDFCAPNFCAPVPVCTRRRLEVTLRGAFKSRTSGRDSGVAHLELAEDDDEDSFTPRCERPASGPVCIFENDVISKPRSQTSPEDILRERMGFGKEEVGAAPSGRTSVPAIRGTCSAPPLPISTRDEGIELESLEASVGHHIRKILDRSFGSPSRATSCEPEEGTPPNSACPSPSPRLRDEELSVRIGVRLCQSRCGSSTAVMELTLDHRPEFCVPIGSSCKPAPAEAEAKLLAYFARHTLLRLSAAHPPVRIIMESLTEASEG